jgi:cellulose synthase (UDP-forming)
MGLAAESIKGYFVQRSRWCRGGIQTLFVHNGPIRGPGLTLFQRLMFIPVSWLVQYVVRLAILIVPAVYFWTGVPPLYFTSTWDIVYYQVPVLLSYFFLMLWIMPSRYLPVVSSAIGVFSTFRMLPTVVASLLRPFGTPFRVTPKGTANERSEFDAYTFTCIAVLIAITAIGVFINVVPEWSTIRHTEFSIVSLYWAAMNIIVLLIAALMCFEKPRPFLDSFAIGEAAQAYRNEKVIPGWLAILSLENGTIEFQHDPQLAPGNELVVSASGFPILSARVEMVAANPDGSVSVRFTHSVEGEARDQLIVKLYTGAYSQEIRRIDRGALLGGLWRRAFGRLPAQA